MDLQPWIKNVLPTEINSMKQLKKDCEEFDRAMLKIHGIEPHKRIILYLEGLIAEDNKRKENDK